jgi:hypothetical protein
MRSSRALFSSSSRCGSAISPTCACISIKSLRYATRTSAGTSHALRYGLPIVSSFTALPPAAYNDDAALVHSCWSGAPRWTRAPRVLAIPPAALSRCSSIHPRDCARTPAGALNPNASVPIWG